MSLVISRKKDEAIHFNTSDGVIRVLLKPRGNNVAVVIQAPPTVKVLREELVDRDARSDNKRERVA